MRTRRLTRAGVSRAAPARSSHAKISGRMPSAVTATTSPRRARPSMCFSAASSSGKTSSSSTPPSSAPARRRATTSAALAPPQVGEELGDRDGGRRRAPLGTRSACRIVVGAVAGGTDREPDLAIVAAQAVTDLDESLHPGLVVGVVDHDDPALELVQVRAAGVALLVEHERLQPSDDRALGQADRERGRGRAERVPHVRRRDAGDRDRDVLRAYEGPSVRTLERREPPVEHRRRAAALAEDLAEGRVVRVGRAEPRPPDRAPAHREHARVVGVQHHPALGTRDPRDGCLDLGELVDRVDAVEAEVVLGHVRDDRDVVVQHADPAEQDAAARRLEHRDVGLLRERPRGAPEPRVVALLHEHAVVAVHAVGRGVRDPLARAPHEVREEPNRRRLPVRPGHLDHRDRRVGHARLVAGRDLAEPCRRGRDRALGRAAGVEERLEEGRDLAAERLGRATPSPGVRDDDLALAGSGAGADREPDIGGRGEPPGQARRDPGDRSAPLLGSGPSTAPAVAAGRGRSRGEPLLGEREPPGHRERELDRGSREVQVRALEHPELDERDRRRHGASLVRRGRRRGTGGTPARATRRAPPPRCRAARPRPPTRSA